MTFQVNQTVDLLDVKVDKRGKAEDDRHPAVELQVRAEMIEPPVVAQILGVESPDDLAGLWSNDPERNRLLLNVDCLKVKPVSFEGRYNAVVSGTDVGTVHKVHGFSEIRPTSGGTFEVVFKIQILDPPAGFIDQCVKQKEESLTLDLQSLGDLFEEGQQEAA